MSEGYVDMRAAPDFGGPRQTSWKGHPLCRRVRDRGRHHLVPLQRKRFRLQSVVVVVVVVFVLAGVVGLVRVLLVEGVQVVLFDQRLRETQWSDGRQEEIQW